MSAPLVQFGPGYAAQNCGNSVSFFRDGELFPSGLEMAPIVLYLVKELEALQKLYVSNLEQSTPRMDVLMVRCKEWMLRTYGETVTDDEVARMFDYCLQPPVAAERSEAQMDADVRGMGFIVHGVRVSPENVTVLDGVEVVDRMRAATQAAADTLAAFRAERALEESVELTQLRRERTYECSLVGPRLAHLCTLVGLTPPSDKPAELYDMAFAILGMVNGKLRRAASTVAHQGEMFSTPRELYDARFLQPLIPPAPGESKACGVCGAIHSGGGLFCDTHTRGE